MKILGGCQNMTTVQGVEILRNDQKGYKSMLYKGFIPKHEATQWFNEINKKAHWKEEYVKIMGKNILAPRTMTYLGDDPSLAYTYAGYKHDAESWPEWIKPLKILVEEHLGVTYNYALINRYQNGDQYIGYHSDSEKSIDDSFPITSLSFGATRDFCFQKKKKKGQQQQQQGITKTKKKKTIKTALSNGDLLTMEGTTQLYWKHAIPKRKSEKKARICITFRVVHIQHQ